MALAPIKIPQKIYQNLRSQIQKIIGATEQKIIADINHERVKMAWEISQNSTRKALKICQNPG